MLHRLVFACAVLVLAALPGSVAAQSGTYDLQWVALCGPDAFNINRNAVSAPSGQLRIIVELVDEGDPTQPPFWTARNASTGAGVWAYAIDGDFGGPGGTYRAGQVQDLTVPGACGSSFFGSFEWNPAGTEDGTLNFHVYNAFPGSSRESTRFHAVGIRVAQPTAQTVTVTAPSAGQVVSGTTPVRATTTGFTGSRQYVLLVDGVQRQTGTISTDSFTLWFNTTRVANGTHTFTLRITQGAATATATLQVTVSN